MDKIKKGSKKVVEFVKGAVKKRYGGGYIRGGLALTRDVLALKALLNVEKKKFNLISPNPYEIGQVNANVSAHVSVDITPIPAQGTTAITRNGGSIKLTSSYMEFLFRQQSACVMDAHGVIEIWKTKGNTIVPSTEVLKMYLANGFVAQYNSGLQIIDTQSNLALSYLGNFQKLKTRKFTIKADQFAGTNGQASVKIGMKYKEHHIRYEDASTVPTKGQLFMVVRVARGNISSTTTSTLNYVPDTALNTGIFMDYNIQHYFVDN